MVLVSQQAVVAQVCHEGQRSPAEEPLDVQVVEPHGVEQDTRTDAEGVGTPLGQGLLVLLWVQKVDRGRNGPHKRLDIGTSNGLDSGGVSIIVDGQWRRRRVKGWVLLEAEIKALKNMVRVVNGAVAVHIGVVVNNRS